MIFIYDYKSAVVGEMLVLASSLKLRIRYTHVLF